ncbi:thiamine-phosphate kinase [Salibacterium halotolerans]|uniref:Thiamine-monophosphate kinase n=1 Tax=Salibacterium halotolerans TaxID=1884432 RepID=A0A1I5P7F3_9BACI|nr:thiamine-phosphate kinase [Salibacterium halotolerans]SFP30044.1 thiamine-monophosphate kinase [Salibacterium halotolerans]
MPKDEFEWIRQHTPERYNHSGVIEGIGDDAAVYAAEDGFDEILCVDTMVEEVHFKKQTMSPYDTGHKALAVNISDIAAMAGIPVYYIVSIAVPPSWTDEELQELYNGMGALAAEYDMDMIGGDTVSSQSGLVISVTVHGRVEKGRHLLRRNALPGDIVFVTNPTGRSAAGLDWLLQHGRGQNCPEPFQTLTAYHQRPRPRVEEGRIIAGTAPTASLNDISDGLASEANEIAEASGVKLQLRQQDIPAATELKEAAGGDSYWDWIFYGGEDFELIGTAREKNWSLLQQNMKEEGFPLYAIGRVQEGPPLVTLLDGTEEQTLPKKGYNHFQS